MPPREAVVPKETEWLNYGVVLVAGGTVWADHFKLLVRTARGEWSEI